MIKEIKGFEEKYEVSDKGDVFSKNYNRQGKVKKLKQLEDKYGYLYVRLSIKRKKTKHKTIHRLVAETFIQNPLSKTQVNHRDGNKKNNNLKNLEWVTPSENILHNYKIGLQKPNVTNQKLSLCEVKEIRKKLKEGIKGKVLAIMFGISPQEVCSIKKGRVWNTSF